MPGQAISLASRREMVLHRTTRLSVRTSLTRELFQAAATVRQLRFLDHQDRQAILDGKAQRTALADKTGFFQVQLRMTWVERTPENFKQFLVDHDVLFAALWDLDHCSQFIVKSLPRQWKSNNSITHRPRMRPVLLQFGGGSAYGIEDGLGYQAAI